MRKVFFGMLAIGAVIAWKLARTPKSPQADEGDLSQSLPDVPPTSPEARYNGLKFFVNVSAVRRHHCPDRGVWRDSGTNSQTSPQVVWAKTIAVSVLRLRKIARPSDQNALEQLALQLAHGSLQSWYYRHLISLEMIERWILENTSI